MSCADLEGVRVAASPLKMRGEGSQGHRAPRRRGPLQRQRHFGRGAGAAEVGRVHGDLYGGGGGCRPTGEERKGRSRGDALRADKVHGVPGCLLRRCTRICISKRGCCCLHSVFNTHPLVSLRTHTPAHAHAALPWLTSTTRSTWSTPGHCSCMRLAAPRCSMPLLSMPAVAAQSLLINAASWLHAVVAVCEAL